MGLAFLDRSLKTTGIVLLVFLPFGIYYLGVYSALAIFTGGVWGLLNLIFLAALVRAFLRPGKADIKKAVGTGLFKFPVLYVSLYFLLTTPHFDPVHLMIGLSIILGVMVLKAVGRVMMKASDQVETGDDARGVA